MKGQRCEATADGGILHVTRHERVSSVRATRSEKWMYSSLDKFKVRTGRREWSARLSLFDLESVLASTKNERRREISADRSCDFFRHDQHSVLSRNEKKRKTSKRASLREKKKERMVSPRDIPIHKYLKR